MSQVIQLLNITPQELADAILDGMAQQIEDLKRDFQPKDPTEWLTRKEVAEMLKISLVTLNEWTKKGVLTSYRIGNRVRYKSHEVEESLKRITK